MEKSQGIEITSKFYDPSKKEDINRLNAINEQVSYIIENLRDIKPTDKIGIEMKRTVTERLKAIMLYASK